jgi:hypothetical protein
MRTPRTARKAAERQVSLRVIQLESRDQPSLFGLSVNVPLVSSLLAPVTPTLNAAAPSLVTVMPIAASASASTPILATEPLAISMATPLANLAVDAQLPAVTAAVQLPGVSSVAQVQTLLGVSVSQPLGVSVSMAPINGTISVHTPVANAVLTPSVGTNLANVTLPPSVSVTGNVNTPPNVPVVGSATVPPSVPVVGGTTETRIASPFAPTTSVAAASVAITTALTLPTATPIIAASTGVVPAPAVATVPVVAVGGTIPFVVPAETPALSAGGPTGGTGTAAPAAGAVPAGTAIGPNGTAAPAANVTGANTCVLLMPQAGLPTEEAGGDAGIAKAGVPALGVRWDGYLMALVAAAYGFWQWKRRFKYSATDETPRLSETAPAAN